MISYPLQLSRPKVFKQQPEAGDLSRSNSYRGFRSAVVVADLVHLDGDLWTLADDPSLIDGLALRPVIVGDDAPGIGTIVTRDIEVADSDVRYGPLDRDAVNERLAQLNIIVRSAVLSE